VAPARSKRAAAAGSFLLTRLLVIGLEKVTIGVRTRSATPLLENKNTTGGKKYKSIDWVAL
jgi:hypothetical protein